MRLINIVSMELEEFFDENIPRYAILSHTWAEKELSYQDWQTIRRFEVPCSQQNGGLQELYIGFERNQAQDLKQTLGFDKITRCCKQVERDGLQYVWIDTCCIDKTSSAELSEAINSMYRWYSEAEVCYAYLADVLGEQGTLKQSRWFTRGWTLQELLAPRKLLFFDGTWTFIAEKSDISELLSAITGIKSEYLCKDRPLEEANISERMSWASRRTTKRKEDMAYCLLGIFGVNMPLLYGEGDRAFVRLQEEIMKESTDQTILAWGYGMRLGAEMNSLLAPSPRYFIHGSQVLPSIMDGPSPSFQMTNKGLQIRLRLYTYPEAGGDCIYAALNCMNKEGKRLWLPILSCHHTEPEDGHEFCKVPRYFPVVVHEPRDTTTEKTIFIARRGGYMKTLYRSTLEYQIKSPSYSLAEVFPPTLFFQSQRISKLEQLANVFLRFDGPDPFILAINYGSIGNGFVPRVGLWDASNPILKSEQCLNLGKDFPIPSLVGIAFDIQAWSVLKDTTWSPIWGQSERVETTVDRTAHNIHIKVFDAAKSHWFHLPANGNRVEVTDEDKRESVVELMAAYYWKSLDF